MMRCREAECFNKLAKLDQPKNRSHVVSLTIN